MRRYGRGFESTEDTTLKLPDHLAFPLHLAVFTVLWVRGASRDFQAIASPRSIDIIVTPHRPVRDHIYERVGFRLVGDTR